MPTEQHVIMNATAIYPKIDRTYRFDTAENRSVPCDALDDGAEYTLQFKTDEDTARALYSYMKTLYNERKKSNWPDIKNPFKKEDDGTFRYKANLKGAYNGEKTLRPAQYDAKTQKLPDDFQLTNNSVVNIAVVGVPYSASMGAGVSLRLRAVQVIELAERQSVSPFDVVDGFDSNESNPFAQSAPTPTPKTDDLDGFDEPVEEPAVEEPTKVVKKSAPAPAESADLSAIIDEWDD